MSEMGKRELTAFVNGMSEKEKQFLISLLPVEYCVDRILQDLNKKRYMEDQLRGTLEYLEDNVIL